MPFCLAGSWLELEWLQIVLTLFHRRLEQRFSWVSILAGKFVAGIECLIPWRIPSNEDSVLTGRRSGAVRLRANFERTVIGNRCRRPGPPVLRILFARGQERDSRSFRRLVLEQHFAFHRIKFDRRLIAARDG